MGGAMYVEVMVPKQIRSPYPVVFFHGAGQTGVDWLQTPDGRPGWAYNFLDMGYVVYMTDFPTRGRSQYVPGVDGTPERPNLNIRTAPNLEEIFTAASARGNFPQAKKHTAWPGTRAHGRQGLRRLREDPGAVPGRPGPGNADARCVHRAARHGQHAGHPADALAGRRVRLARRRCAAEPGEGDHDAGAGGTSDPRRRPGQAGLQRGRRPELGRGEQSDRPTSRPSAIPRNCRPCSRPQAPRPTRCRATCSSSRRAS